MAEKGTKTSSPPSCSMKPYPFASLNHFTFPLAIRAASCKVIRERRVRLLRTLRAVRDRNVARQNPCQAPRRPSLHRPGYAVHCLGGGRRGRRGGGGRG